jgi:hypothetical protein
MKQFTKSEPDRLVTVNEVTDHEHEPTGSSAEPAPVVGVTQSIAGLKLSSATVFRSSQMGRNTTQEIAQACEHVREAINVLNRIAVDCTKAYDWDGLEQVKLIIRKLQGN